MGMTNTVWQQQQNATATHRAAILGKTSAENRTEVDAWEEMLTEEVEMVLLAGKLISHAANGNDARLHLIDSLRQRINAGTYKVSAMEVVESLVGAMRPDTMAA